MITAIGGTAGIGKTALAVHWAHRIADRFPDGQLFANLRGFDPVGAPRQPAEVVRVFLEALGVPARDTPADAEVQVGLYRSLLAGKRMLIVLDNARDTEQVRPLLPGSAGCLAIVTSRDRLLGLVAGQGARQVTLDVLSAAEAQQLLANRLGSHRVSQEPAAAQAIALRCSMLPLAMAVAAARAAASPHLPLRTIADALFSLDGFGGTSAATDLRSVFSWSYRALSPGAARLFCLLGLHPGPDITVPAAASLAGLPRSAAWGLLNELATAHLVAEHQPGRYTFHDLLRAYAIEQDDHESERPDAVRRGLDHYVHSAHAAAVLVEPNLATIPLAAAPPEGLTERPADRAEALAWFSAERRVLRRTVDWAASHGLDDHVGKLAWAVASFLNLQGYWHDNLAFQQLALLAAERCGDAEQQAQAHRRLARVYTWLSRFDAADEHSRSAIELLAERRDVTGLARTYHQRAFNFAQQSRYREALGCAEHELRYARADGFRRGEASALNGIGWCRAQLGELTSALEHCHEALAIYREVNDRSGEASTLDSIGYILRRLGDHSSAVRQYQAVVDLYRQLDDRYGTATALIHLGETHQDNGHTAASVAVWHEALGILNELDHPDANQVHAKLAVLTASRPAGSGRPAGESDQRVQK